MLPNYYRHIKKYESSLFVKLYGLHVVRSAGGVKVKNLYQYFEIGVFISEVDALLLDWYTKYMPNKRSQTFGFCKSSIGIGILKSLVH